MIDRARYWKKLSLGVACALLIGTQSVLAGPLEEGKKAYAAKRYSDALKYFGEAGRQTPSNPEIYYYLGLTYEGMHQYGMARQNLQWVAGAAGNSAIGVQAQQALAQLEKTHPAPAGQQSQMQVQQSLGQAAATRPQIAGRLRVYEFWTKWCKYCTEFKPVWEQVSSELRDKADFRSIDAEVDETMTKRFNVTRFPRVIYVDGNGKVLLERSWYKTPEDFKRDLSQFIAI